LFTISGFVYSCESPAKLLILENCFEGPFNLLNNNTDSFKTPAFDFSDFFEIHAKGARFA